VTDQGHAILVPLGTPIDQRWNAVLSDLPAIGKDSVNQQQGFKFRSIDTVLTYLNPLLAGYGLHIIPTSQSAVYDSYTTGRGTQMWRCRITVDWEIRSVDGEVIHAQTMGTGTDTGDKETSKAQTMAFKYLLWPATAVADNDDPDGSVPEEGVAHTATALAPQAYEEINGSQIPVVPAAQTTRMAPGGGSAATVTDKQGKMLYAMAKSAFGGDSDVPAEISELIGRTIRRTDEVYVSEFDHLTRALKAAGA
jgi:hypothetical protein